MNDKLRIKGTEDVKKLLDGSHDSQTKKTYGWQPDIKIDNVKHEVGDEWIDETGKTCIQRDGYVYKRMANMDAVFDLVNKYVFSKGKLCPSCNKPMIKRLDKKLFMKSGKCFDCVIVEETQMRINGTYDEYERKKIINNVSSWLKDAEIEKEILKRALDPKFVYQDGRMETWKNPMTPEDIDAQFINFKKKLLSQYEVKESELNAS